MDNHRNTVDQKATIQAARIAITTATTLAVIKIVAGSASASMALLSSAVDSLLDLFMSFANLLALRQADKPADEDHPYGHGKFETAATLLQSLIIAASGSYILYESTNRLLHGSNNIQHLNIGIAVLTFSSIASWFLSDHLKKVGIRTGSTALQADGLHYATDVYSNLALLLGLVIIKVFHWYWIDPLLSIGVGCYILFASFELLKGSINDFLDTGLPADQRQQIVDCINQFSAEISGFHNLRTRRSGKYRMIDFHLTFCHYITIKQAHDCADRVETTIKQQINNADITIHLESSDCSQCQNNPHCAQKHIATISTNIPERH